MTDGAPILPAAVGRRVWDGPSLPAGRGRTLDPRTRRLAALGIALTAVLIGGLSTFDHGVALGACLVASFVVAVWMRPAIGAYVLIVFTPLTAGIDRGLAIPVFRPSEALALLIGGTLIARGLVRLRTGYLPRLRPSRVELSIVLLAVTSSFVPLLWMLARQRDISQDDIMYALVMWKFLGLYAIVRTCISTDRQINRCLWASVLVACPVALIAVLQSLQIAGVEHLLAPLFSPFGHAGALQHARGSSTLALPAATADLLIYNLAIAAGLWLGRRRHTRILALVALLCVFGVLSSGEFSSALGLVIGVVCIAFVTGVPWVLAVFVPAAAIAGAALRPVIETRLSGFQSASGLPVSWTGRLDNLRTYFWPVLSSDWNFLFGVRPSARVPVASQATGYVWIESGYTWLLWGGGIPLLASFVFFVHSAASMAWRAARSGPPGAGAAGVAAFVAVIVTSVLMVFDPHLTYRGSADLLFFLLALAAPRVSREPADERDARPQRPGKTLEKRREIEVDA
jgi:hypothetical protein